MLYFDSTSTNATFYINANSNSGDIIDFNFVREGKSSDSYTESVELVDGGYYQSVSFDLSSFNTALTDGATYDVFAYSGGILVYQDKLYYNSTRDVDNSSIEEYVENTTSNDYIIFD